MPILARIGQALNAAAITNLASHFISAIYDKLASGVTNGCAQSLMHWLLKDLLTADPDVIRTGILVAFVLAAFVFCLCRASLAEAQELGVCLLVSAMLGAWAAGHNIWINYHAQVCVMTSKN